MCTVTIIPTAPLTPVADATGSGLAAILGSSGRNLLELTPVAGRRAKDKAENNQPPQPVRMGYKLACNRDQPPNHPADQMPTQRTVDQRTVLMPANSTGEGSWIAVNDAGVSMVMLNSRPEGAEAQTRRSRSPDTIIAGLLSATSARGAAELALKLNPADYEPFRLIITDGLDVIQVRSNTQHIEFTIVGMLEEGPFLFASSPMGDHLVEAARWELFSEMFNCDPADWPSRQQQFHNHRWPDRPEQSVDAFSEDARTCNWTVIGAETHTVSMWHHANAPHQPGREARLQMTRSAIPATARPTAHATR
jgi:Transport and Golgi organisation 2